LGAAPANGYTGAADNDRPSIGQPFVNALVKSAVHIAIFILNANARATSPIIAVAIALVTIKFSSITVSAIPLSMVTIASAFIPLTEAAVAFTFALSAIAHSFFGPLLPLLLLLLRLTTLRNLHRRCLGEAGGHPAHQKCRSQ
jgi:hypothetical protein